MDWLTFIATVLGHLAWPVAAIVVVLLLRDEIKQLLKLIKKLKAGPVEAEFEREVKELVATVDATESQLPPDYGSPDQQFLIKLAEVSPRSAILEAWRKVEAAIYKAIDRNAVYVAPREVNSPFAAIRALTKSGHISNEELALYHDLRTLRNQAAHKEEFAPNLDAALSYISLALKLEKAVAQHGG